MINCESCRELLPEFSLGELDPRDQKKVKFHLRQCRDCAVELAEYRRIWSVLPLALDPVDPPESVRTLVMDRVRKSPRVERSTRRDRSLTPERPQRTRSNRDRRWQRYLLAALILVCLFVARSYFADDGTNQELLFANNPTINERVVNVAASTGFANKKDGNRWHKNFIYVRFAKGKAFDSAGVEAEGYAILNRLTERCHFFANNLGESGSGDFKLWLEGADGTILDSTKLVVREFGNTRCSLYLPSNQAFARALITRETDASSRFPSSEVVFEAILLRPLEQPELVELSEITGP